MQTAHDEIESLLDKMKAASGNSRLMASIGEQISILCRAYMEPVGTAIVPGVRFTPNEAAILRLLISKAGRSVRRDALLDAASFHHGWDSEPTAKMVDVYVCRLRKKLEGSAYTIETAWGTGYSLINKSEQAKAA